MIEYTAQRVFCITALRRVLYGFADGNAQTAWGVRVLRQDRASGLRIFTRTGDHLALPRSPSSPDGRVFGCTRS